MTILFNRSIALVLCLALCWPAFAASPLSNHPSPYLKLHADDPVDWQLWSSRVLHHAADQNKLIYLSIGYFSCHWCHVMQQESYQDPAIGKYLNAHFIPVKVDRELRPDLDRRLIRFVEAVNGQAGWPLNVFLTPDGYPLTGFTYLPRDDFHSVLQQLNEQWRQRSDELAATAKAYFEQSESSTSRSTLLELPVEHNDKLVDAFVSQSMLIADEMQGGFGQISKFPSYPQLKALLEVIERFPQTDPDVTRFVQLTLDSMASEHLMDQVNGGFFRYVTDPDWQTPHFEKMLYDNAQLALLYFQAHAMWPDRGYAGIGLRTIDFMLAFLRDDSGAFSSSLSAVDAGQVEGAAYYWSRSDLRALLSAVELEWLTEQLPSGQEQVLIPPLVGHFAVASPGGLGKAVQDKLVAARRPLMPVDDKKLATWNALALRALLAAETYRPTSGFATHADRLYRFMVSHLMEQDRVVRMAGAGDAFAETTLADFAHAARALQAYAERRNHAAAASLSVKLVDRALSEYLRDGRWVQDTQSLIPGQTGEWVIQDAVLQSPQSLLLETALASIAAESPLRGRAEKLVSYLTRDMLDLPFHYASSILLRHRYQSGVAKQ